MIVAYFEELFWHWPTEGRRKHDKPVSIVDLLPALSTIIRNNTANT
jgi:hypothetical protein